MKAVMVFFLLGMIAMAAAQGVHVVNNNRPGGGNYGGFRPDRPMNFVNNNPNDPTSVNFVNNNPNDPTSVNFVNNNPNDPTSVHVVDNNPYDPSAVHVVNNNPYDPSAVHVVNNNPGQVNLNNPDPAFARPEYEQPDISPAWAPNPNTRPPYPYKQYANQYARGG